MLQWGGDMNCPNCNSDDYKLIGETGFILAQLGGGVAGGWVFTALTASMALNPIMLPLLIGSAVVGTFAMKEPAKKLVRARCAKCRHQWRSGIDLS